MVSRSILGMEYTAPAQRDKALAQCVHAWERDRKSNCVARSDKIAINGVIHDSMTTSY